ncbi:MAG TPA: universal stress protein [Luteimonas sp.]|nr:universal stress protein [Luteimonas sp.]HRO26382.1 universal stress protein [Luteimonas sp.]HRP71565.1 universal stress protein [Luteimonas sp.]
MSESNAVLLATDLDFRCDRATDRAIALARGFGGAAIAATVVDPSERRAQQVRRHAAPAWYREPSPTQAAERRLRHEFADQAQRWTLRVGEGRAADHLLPILDGLDGEPLVVTGPVRDGVIGPTVLGSTVDRLLRREGRSLLMVRRRVHGDYRRLLVASDFSGPCRRALQRARSLFPNAAITVLHGFEVPMLGLLDSSQEHAIAQAAAQLREEGHAFLREAGLADDEVELRIEHGDPARLVQQHLETFEDDLVVLGTHGRGAVYELVVGSVARRILTTVDADALVVRD